MTAPKAARKSSSRLARTIRSLFVIAGIGGSLAVLNFVTVGRDIGLATGAEGPDQHQFFIGAAERPDLELFFKALSHEQRMQMAGHLGSYDDPEVAKVAVKLLGTFDAEARETLKNSLVKIAKKKPQSVVDQLTVSGSFQQLAISQAVQTVGAPAIPLVAEKLADADARGNAISLLVDLKEPSIPYVLPKLSDKSADVRLAAADVLGKLRVREAVPKLTELYAGAQGDERLNYLSALASIGDPRSEDLLRTALDDESLGIPNRSQAALGLGRVGTPSAASALARYVHHPDQTFAESALSGLVLAGDTGLEERSLDLETRIRVAGGLRSEVSRKFLEQTLAEQPLPQAADAASGQEELVPSLVAAARSSSDGEVLDHIARALATTDSGRKALETLEADPKLGGYAFRRLQMSAG